MPTAYKVIPAPDRPLKSKAHKTPQAQFAAAVEEAINAQAAEGWRYLRTDTLPCEVRQGLTGKTTVFRSVLVFERAEDGATEPETAAPAVAPEPPLTRTTPEPAPAAEQTPPQQDERPAD